jgi:hypothetical protein
MIIPECQSLKEKADKEEVKRIKNSDNVNDFTTNPYTILFYNNYKMIIS